jgi:hypothetical protein
MLGRIPGAAGEPVVAPPELDPQVLGLHALARDRVGQIGHAQLHCCDLREAEIFFAERRRDDTEARH